MLHTQNSQKFHYNVHVYVATYVVNMLNVNFNLLVTHLFSGKYLHQVLELVSKLLAGVLRLCLDVGSMTVTMIQYCVLQGNGINMQWEMHILDQAAL